MPERATKKTGTTGHQDGQGLLFILVPILVAAIVVPVAILKPPPVENRATADGIQPGYAFRYLPEDVDVVFVQYLKPEFPKRALDEIKKTRTVRDVIVVGGSVPSKEYIFLLERAEYLP